MITRIGVDWYQEVDKARQYFVFYIEDGVTKLDDYTYDSPGEATCRAQEIGKGKTSALYTKWTLRSGNQEHPEQWQS
jgi:hypothetical protein